MNTPVLAWIGLGGNVGEPAETLRAALRELDGLPHTRLLKASRLYRTRAWGRAEQPDFINAAARVETLLGARELLDGLLDIERGFGRVRAADGRDRWGPRVLDLDLLLYGDARIDEPGLRVPHPHLHERTFALLPLLEIDPAVVIPGHGSARAALDKLDSSDIEVVG